MNAIAYPVMPHLAGSTGTPDDEFGPAGDLVRVLKSCSVVQEKLDGLCVGIRVAQDLVQAVLKDRVPSDAERCALVPLLDTVAERLRRLRDDVGPLCVFGELLEPGRPVLANWRVFDVLDESASRFWASFRVAEAARALGATAVPVLHRGPLRTAEELLRLAASGDPPREGIVVRVESGRWLRERYKFVVPGFEKTLWSLR